MWLTGESNPVDVSVESLVANLPELLGAMMDGDRRVVAIAELADHRYVQFLGGEGRLVAEVTSNLNGGPTAVLSAGEEERLRAAGWREPSPGPMPNWYVRCPDDAPLGAVVTMAAGALGLLVAGRPTPARVRTFRGRPRAGGVGETPRGGERWPERGDEPGGARDDA
jgi:T3SS (YopN, CesT) and YbjN peptide-binding chaperone 3